MRQPGENGRTNPLIVWTEACHLNVPVLDQQHHGMVEIINDLHDALRNKSDEQMLGQILQQLQRYTRTHFATEEELLARSDYPDLPAHKRLHEAMISRTDALVVKFNAHRDVPSQDVLRFLKEWWLGHILTADRQHAGYLSQSS